MRIDELIKEMQHEIDGGEECQGFDTTLSHWINTLDAIETELDETHQRVFNLQERVNGLLNDRKEHIWTNDEALDALDELEGNAREFNDTNTGKLVLIIRKQLCENTALRQENEALKKAQEWVAKFTNTDSDSDLMKRWDILRNQLLSYPESSSGREIFESIIDEINDQVTPPKGDE